jgi:hypothetical protein
MSRLTPFAKYSGQFFKAYGYSDALVYEARRFIEIRFAKEFKYFETVIVEELKAYIKLRMDGQMVLEPGPGHLWRKILAL